MAILSKELAVQSSDFLLSLQKYVEHLPFQVLIAEESDLPEVAALRSASYGKHLPELGAKLMTPEPADFESGCEVLIARSKLDGSLLGTLRTHANVFVPLPLQASMQLPNYLLGSRMVETTRLCVKGNPNSSVVRSALFKALYLYCMNQKADWIVATGRRPVDRIYDGLLFTDVAKAGEYYPMAHVGGVPHRVMCFDLLNAQRLWKSHDHPLYTFVIETNHPDIDLRGTKSLGSNWASQPVELDSGFHAPELWPDHPMGIRVQTPPSVASM